MERVPQPKPVLEGQLWRVSHPKGKARAARGIRLLVLSPLPLPETELGWGGEAANSAWKHFNLLSESNRPAPTKARTSSATWKELMCSKTRALDANLWCLTLRQGRAWAPSVIGMSVWTEPR